MKKSRSVILKVSALLAGLSGCSHHGIEPQTSVQRFENAKNENAKGDGAIGQWAYVLSPVKNPTNNKDGSFTVWHNRHSAATFKTRADCEEEGRKALSKAGWNMTMRCETRPESSIPIRGISAEELLQDD